MMEIDTKNKKPTNNPKTTTNFLNVLFLITDLKKYASEHSPPTTKDKNCILIPERCSQKT